MTRIYTRTGDSGLTGLFGGQRVSKDDLRVEAYGTVDELNALLGVARTHAAQPVVDYVSPNAVADADLADLGSLLERIQSDLFTLGSDLATPDDKDTNKGRIHIQRTTEVQVAFLEQRIDQYEAELLPLTAFILPGGSVLAACLHHARTVCRRAERRCVTLARAEAESSPVNPDALRYLNRLSDLLFVIARVANHRQGVADILWTNPAAE